MQNATSWQAADDSLPAAAKALQVWPLDASNASLLDSVHPRSWQPADHEESHVYDIIAVGAGAGGLVTSKQAARRGARSAMISEHLAGGDCLNVGCVPSKALLHCARVAREARAAIAEGILVEDGTTRAPNLAVNFGAVMARMRRLRARIAVNDSHEATVLAGADVFQGRGRFVGPNEIQVNGRTLRFKKACIATGGRAAVPQVEGLSNAPYLTNATLFNLCSLPRRMVVLGAGAVGLEMAQAFANFGCKVTCLVRSTVLSKEEPAAGEAVRRALQADGVKFLDAADLFRVETVRVGGGAYAEGGQMPLLRVTVGCKHPGRDETVMELECEALLVASGRLPNVEDLGLEAAGIHVAADGIKIDDYARTSNPNVFAVGDCASGVPNFTHVSGEMAKLVVQNALFDDSWRVSSLVVPRCAYTEPEVAGVGLTRREAEQRGDAVDTYRTTLEHNDRAICEGRDAEGGFVEVLCERGTDRVLGALVVAANAGDMINELSVAIQAGVGLNVLARVIHPYPTLGEAVMGAALNIVRKHWKKLEPETSLGSIASEGFAPEIDDSRYSPVKELRLR